MKLVATIELLADFRDMYLPTFYIRKHFAFCLGNNKKLQRKLMHKRAVIMTQLTQTFSRIFTLQLYSITQTFVSLQRYKNIGIDKTFCSYT